MKFPLMAAICDINAIITFIWPRLIRFFLTSSNWTRTLSAPFVLFFPFFFFLFCFVSSTCSRERVRIKFTRVAKGKRFRFVKLSSADISLANAFAKFVAFNTLCRVLLQASRTVCKFATNNREKDRLRMFLRTSRQRCSYVCIICTRVLAVLIC